VSLAAMHPGRCSRCHGKIERGDAIDYFPPATGVAAEVRHVECPKAPAPAHGAPRRPADLPVDEAECSGCGASWARPKHQGGVPDGALCPCCGERLRVDPEPVE
jgi:hypothetical protein